MPGSISRKVAQWREVAELDSRAGQPVGAALRDACNLIEGLIREVRIAEQAGQRIERVLDTTLGVRAEDGAGAGMAADVELLAARYLGERQERVAAQELIDVMGAQITWRDKALEDSTAERKRRGQALVDRQRMEAGAPVGAVRACARRLIEWCNDRDASPTVMGSIVGDLNRIAERFRDAEQKGTEQ
jgi:hypothetical protein